ncbi:hypothetical protein LCGC14_2646650, partial [marine sediment metagenome]
MRRLLIILAVLFSASTLWGASTISQRKVYSNGQIFTATDYNLDLTHFINAYNVLAILHPGDSTVTVYAGFDTVISKGISKIVYKDPLVGFDTSDSLLWSIGHFFRANADTVDAVLIERGDLSQVTTGGGSWAFTGTIDNSGATVEDAGTIATVDINGGTIDGTVIGGASAKAGTFTAITGSLSASFDGGQTTTSLKSTATTETTSGSSGAIYTAGGLGVAKDVYIGDDVLQATGGVYNWAAGDVTLTHSAGKLTYGGDGAVEIDFNNHEMTNVDINSGAIDGTVIGGASAKAGSFTSVTSSISSTFSGGLSTTSIAVSAAAAFDAGYTAGATSHMVDFLGHSGDPDT